ncbi:dipeptide epimerase [Bacillus tianshenii]|nr:dipeptide epimerase [Bacillus tianshenii]
MKITSINLYAIKLPFIEPFIISYETYHDMPSIIVEIKTDTGIIGYGEGVPDEHVTGETFESAFAMLKNTIAPSLIGEDPFNLEGLHEKMDALVYGAPTAKAAIDIACYDVIGKATGQPVFNLLGGRYSEELEVARVLSIEDPETMAAKTSRAIDAGFQTIKVKVGTDIELDIQRIRAVCKAAEGKAQVKVDANQGWKTSADSLYVLKQVEDCPIRWIEQPVMADNIDALAEVKRKTHLPVMIDEGLHGMKELRETIAKNAADKVNIKLMKCGGLYPALKLVAQAEMAGMSCQIGSMVESSVASSAGLHLATAKRAIESQELTGPLMFSKDIGSLPYQQNTIRLTNAPGLGVEVDLHTLQELTVEKAEIG